MPKTERDIAAKYGLFSTVTGVASFSSPSKSFDVRHVIRSLIVFFLEWSKSIRVEIWLGVKSLHRKDMRRVLMMNISMALMPSFIVALHMPTKMAITKTSWSWRLIH